MGTKKNGPYLHDLKRVLGGPFSKRESPLLVSAVMVDERSVVDVLYLRHGKMSFRESGRNSLSST